MSHAKFAPMTASLLARKGEAAPWTNPVHRPAAWAADVVDTHEFAPAPPQPALHAHVPVNRPAHAAPPPSGAKMHKYALHMSETDYERLGLIAVKSGSTRQQLMQQALADFLAIKARAYGGQCACLESCDTGCCGDAAVDGA